MEVAERCERGSPPNCVPASMGCCRIESIVSVDERGQMVLPKEIREKADIRAGDKLAVIAWEGGGEICCLTLVKAGALAEMAKALLGPRMKEMFGE